MHQFEMKVKPSGAWDQQDLLGKARQIHLEAGGDPNAELAIDRRSLDARGKHPIYRLRVQVSPPGERKDASPIRDRFREVAQAPPVHIVGAGPAGYFAALECLERGWKPIVIERGKDARSRRRDLRDIQQFGKVNPDSNYCFGEGGAGTYSDGKLYTRSHKRGNIEKVMRLLVEHGAKEDILIDAHPHIGSNKLPGIIEAIRQSILSCGGEIHFDTSLTDIQLQSGRVYKLQYNGNEWSEPVEVLVLATGHSARDIYELLNRRAIELEAKPFALGLRFEHPQELIDEIQYNQKSREEGLPAAAYKLAHQVKGRGVYSFCMCPGGLIVPAATAPGEIVVNGMSLSRRDSPYSNSGIVVELKFEDFKGKGKDPVFWGLAFQKQVEQKVFEQGDGSQKAPAQRLTDLLEGKPSRNLPDSSYIPGLTPGNLEDCMPPFILSLIREAIPAFDKKMKGYLTREAIAVATESRTSSPIRIPRDRETMMHPRVRGLFPAGEGAGYAGGIVSAALDGQNIIGAVTQYLQKKRTTK